MERMIWVSVHSKRWENVQIVNRVLSFVGGKLDSKE